MCRLTDMSPRRFSIISNLRFGFINRKLNIWFPNNLILNNFFLINRSFVVILKANTTTTYYDYVEFKKK